MQVRAAQDTNGDWGSAEADGDGPAAPAAWRQVNRALLTDAPFEQEAHSTPILWLRRWAWRRRLRALLREPDAVLADFGTTRSALLAYLRRPLWRR